MENEKTESFKYKKLSSSGYAKSAWIFLGLYTLFYIISGGRSSRSLAQEITSLGLVVSLIGYFILRYTEKRSARKTEKLLEYDKK